MGSPVLGYQIGARHMGRLLWPHQKKQNASKLVDSLRYQGLNALISGCYDNFWKLYKRRKIMNKSTSLAFLVSTSVVLLATQASANQVVSITTSKTTSYALEDLKKTDKLTPGISFSDVMVYAGDRNNNFEPSDMLSNPTVYAQKPNGVNQVDFSFTDNLGLSGVFQSNERISVSSSFTSENLERLVEAPVNYGTNTVSLTRSAGLSSTSIDFTLSPYTAVTFYRTAETAFFWIVIT